MLSGNCKGLKILGRGLLLVFMLGLLLTPPAGFS